MICTEHDVLMICKGHYNSEKYKNEKEALEEYYYRNYSYPGHKKELSYEFLVQLFLKPCLLKVLEENGRIRSFLLNGLFDRSYHEFFVKYRNMSFYEVLYYRIVKWFCENPVYDSVNEKYIIDVAEYKGKDVLEDM